MKFDFSNKNGLDSLNKHLQDRSYIDGYLPTRADILVFEALAGLPVEGMPHLIRWQRHIASFSDERKASLSEPSQPVQLSSGTAKPVPAANAEEDDDDDFDCFADETDEEKAAKEEAVRKRLEEEEKKKKEKGPSKSQVILDVKPWDDDTDLEEMEKQVRAIQIEGLVWGNSQLVPVAFGVKKLQIASVIIDDLVSMDDVEEQIVGIEDLVQSMDIVAFNKL